VKAVKYLFAIWAGVLIYALLSIVFGAMGISAFRQLEGEIKKQEANIENLKLINRELEDTMNSLRYDEDALAVYAREQGYASRGERFIRIVGLGQNQRNRTYAGELVTAADPQYISDQTLRIFAFCTGITIIVCMAIFDILRFFRERE
jgi:cell division protein FtsB